MAARRSVCLREDRLQEQHPSVLSHSRFVRSARYSIVCDKIAYSSRKKQDEEEPRRTQLQRFGITCVPVSIFPSRARATSEDSWPISGGISPDVSTHTKATRSMDQNRLGGLLCPNKSSCAKRTFRRGHETARWTISRALP